MLFIIVTNTEMRCQIPLAAVVAFCISWLFVAMIYRCFSKGAKYIVG